jgi:serine/threonine protein kinase
MLGLKPEYFDEIDSPVLKHREAGPFRIGRLLGKGVSGSAYLGTHKLNGFQVALKIVKKSRFLSNPDRWKVLRREIAVMKLLDHPHVLKLYDVFESSDRIFLVTELAQGGELFDYIKDGVLPIQTALKLFAQITMGLLHCHNHGIAHRDLKPENLLLDSEFNIKIADFGMAQLIKEGSFLKTSCGSPHYVSPELIDGKYEGKSSDVWSLGVILYAIVTGCLPFDHQNVPTLLRIVQKGEFEIPEEVDADVQDLIRAMIKVDVKERIKMEDIFNHRVFQEGNYFSEKEKSYFSSETPRSTTVTSIDEGVLADVAAILSVDSKDDSIQAKILEPGENAEKSLYHLLMDRKNRRLLQLTRLSPLSSRRTLASFPPRSTSPPMHRRLLSDELDTFQLADAPTPSSRVHDHLEITSKFLLDRGQLMEPDTTSPRSSISGVSSLPSSGVSSVASSTNPSRRGSGMFSNLTISSAPSSVPPSRRESLLAPIASTPSSRRESINEEQLSIVELLRRQLSRKKPSPTTEKPSVTVPETSPSSSRCTSPSPQFVSPRSSRCSSPNPPRRWFASLFKRRPSLDPCYNNTPPKAGTDTRLPEVFPRSSRRPRSNSLPTNSEDELPKHDPTSKTSQSEISCTSSSSSSSPAPSLFSLFIPPSPSTSSSSHSSLFSPTSPNSNTLALPTLFEERS